jgi:aspartate racemase
MIRPHPVLGIIGGMGPEATVEFMARLVKATPARDDADHLHMIVDNNPKIPSRIAALIDGTGQSPEAELVRMARNLESAGATFLAMPCNTAHGYAGVIARAAGIPFINMVEETVRAIASSPHRYKNVGLLASTAVVKLGLYHAAFEMAQINTCLPHAQESVMHVIKSVKRGDTGPSVRQGLVRAAHQLVEQGADVLLIACTELSVIADSLPKGIAAIDSLNVLRDVVLAHAERQLS